MELWALAWLSVFGLDTGDTQLDLCNVEADTLGLVAISQPGASRRDAAWMRGLEPENQSCTICPWNDRNVVAFEISPRRSSVGLRCP